MKASRKTIRKRSTGAQQHLLVADVLPLLMQRFDNIDTDNRDIIKRIDDHIEIDNKFYKIVEQHKTYWGLTIKALLGIVSGAFLVFITWFGMH